MKFTPKAIFFDWDHTLWDHDLNAKEVLLDLAAEYELAIEPLSYWATFEKINNGLWDQYAAGEISQAELRETRFVRFFQELRVEGPAGEFGDKYLERAPRKTNLMPGAFEVIQDLAAHFPLYILTNGFDDIQYVKIEGAGMRSFFQEIITSQQVGTKKPNPWGLHDMHGNVSEWVLDQYDAKFFATLAGKSAKKAMWFRRSPTD